jgi:Family of unknown function (DUF5681)
MFKKGQSGNPSGLPKNPPSPERRLEEQARREVYGEVLLGTAKLTTAA